MSHPLPRPCDDTWLCGLPAPVKNRFFYGMLLTDSVFQTEQRYGDGKRWLLNRLSLGHGVLTGLDFKVSEDVVKDCPGESKRWRVHLDPGVAVDGYGREIVVPKCEEIAAYEIAHIEGCNVTFANNVDEFLAKFDPIANNEATLLLQIALDTTPTDPAPVKAGRCAHDCEPSKTREEFRLRVVVKEDPRVTNTDTEERWSAVDPELHRKHQDWTLERNLDGVFPPEPSEDILHRSLAQAHPPLVAPVVPVTKQDAAMWVNLGLLKLTITPPQNKGPKTLSFERIGRYYRQLFSNDALSRLIFGLADRVDEAARVRILTLNAKDSKSGNGQSAYVYQPLENPLQLQVIDSNGAPLLDHESICVQFEIQTPDGGILSKSEFDKTRQYASGSTSVNVKVDEDGFTEKVYWRLHATPGLHTVSARILAANEKDPPFHPGSQLVLHATALATAPTIIGMEFDDLWWHDEKCRKYEWTSNGELSFRFVFSRKIVGHEKLPDFFQVWALYRFHDCGPVVWPQRLDFKPFNPRDCRPVCPDPTSDEEVSWQVEGTLKGLFRHLCPGDTLRLVVLGNVPSGAELKSMPSKHFPTPQTLDPTFDGSFLSTDFRRRLWEEGEPHFGKTSDDERAVAETQPTNPDGQTRPVAGQLDRDQRGFVRCYWERFRPRECCLPTGDGTEGGEFHKTFEFRLPCPC